MVTIEDRSVLGEGVRRTRGPQVPRTSSAEKSTQARFQDIDIPTALLQRAITSASNKKGTAEHSELMDFLRAQNDAYGNKARILIDSALADSLSKEVDQRDDTQVRVYDLDDPWHANIRSKIKPFQADAHLLFLTVRQ
jgi:hypothetical protein